MTRKNFSMEVGSRYRNSAGQVREIVALDGDELEYEVVDLGPNPASHQNSLPIGHRARVKATAMKNWAMAELPRPGIWKLRVDRACPSQNKFAFSHWRVAHRSKEEWGWRIRAALGVTPIPKATGRRRLTILRHGVKAVDLSNIIGGAKGIIDNFVQLGLLVDDSPQWLEIYAENRRLPKDATPHTVFVFEDVA